MAQTKQTKTTTAKRKTTAKPKKQAGAAEEKQPRIGRHALSVILFALGILFTLITAIEGDKLWLFFHNMFFGLMGMTAWLLGPVVIYSAVYLALGRPVKKVRARILQLTFSLVLICAIIQVVFFGHFSDGGFASAVSDLYMQGIELKSGGVLSLILGWMIYPFTQIGAAIILILILFVFIMLLANITLIDFFNAIAKPFKKATGYAKEKHTERSAERIQKQNEENRKKVEELAGEINFPDGEAYKKLAEIKHTMDSIERTNSDGETVEPSAEEESLSEKFIENISSYATEKPDEADGLDAAINEFSRQTTTDENIENQLDEAANGGHFAKHSQAEYRLPAFDLLNPIVHTKSDDDVNAELERNSVKLIETLDNFGVKTKIVGVCRGPSVTRYEIQPAAGVKISKITSLVDDIALNLASAGVRIEAPIPNKAAVGIEVPNKTVDTVSFREMIDSKAFAESKSKLAAVLGMDISGEIIMADIAKMPHILIAGTTGSGKSVCVNSIIMSILFRSTPDEVRLLMIDPKAVEFMIYNGIPHLLIPVVTDPKKASGALAWAVTEMLNRYKLFSDNNVRDLGGYNELASTRDDMDKLPQIVIFIDELADLMMAAPGEVEDSICRLAQMARAAGMHLVIATQRPSVNVVTGVIKANIPSRIALKVASQVDSRTIIDSAGAEKLMGKGDMLYFPVGMPKPVRVQGCWVSEKEIDRVVEFIKQSFSLAYDEGVMAEIDKQAELVGSKDKKSSDESGDIDVDDEKLDEAIEAVIEAGQASTSYLQRKLKLGYGRAARLIDTMESMGVVGEYEGSKPRQVLMTKQEWYERKLNQR